MTTSEVVDSVLRPLYNNRNTKENRKMPIFAFMALRSDIIEVCNTKRWYNEEVKNNCISPKMFNQILKLPKYEAIKETIDRNRFIYFCLLFLCISWIILALVFLHGIKSGMGILILSVVFVLAIWGDLKLSFDLTAWMTIAAWEISSLYGHSPDSITSIPELLARRKEFLDYKKNNSTSSNLSLGFTLWDSTEALAYLYKQEVFKRFKSTTADTFSSYEEAIKALTGVEILDDKLMLIIKDFETYPEFSFLEKCIHDNGLTYFILPGGNGASPKHLWDTIVTVLNNRYYHTLYDKLDEKTMKSFNEEKGKYTVPRLQKILRKKGFTAKSDPDEAKLCFSRSELKKYKY